jgi:hypothetical protein
MHEWLHRKGKKKRKRSWSWKNQFFTETVTCIESVTSRSLVVSAGPSSPGVEAGSLEKKCDHKNLPQDDIDSLPSEEPMDTPAQSKLAVQLDEELKLQDFRECGLATSNNVIQIFKNAKKQFIRSS